jgi:hypothetical protein
VSDLKFKLGLQLQQHYEEIERHTSQAEMVEAILIQMTMLELAEEFPRIQSFSFSAEMEYDDESSYFWAAWFSAEDVDGEQHSGDEMTEPLNDWTSSQNAVLKAFGVDEWEGTITVAKLREEFAKTGG